MPRLRKKGFTAAQSKRTSARMDRSTIGTHNQPRARARSSANGAGVGFSNPRKSKRAARGMVSNLGTSASSGESDRSYSRRVNGREYSEVVRKKAARRRIGVIAFIIVAMLAVGIFAGTNVYFFMMGGRLSLDDASATQVLTAAEQGKPYYVLVSADLDASNGCDTDVDMLSLVRVDETEKHLTTLAIPSSTYVSLTDGTAHQIKDARYVGGTQELVQTVSGLTGVSISHLVTADAAGITKLVDQMGGVKMTLSEEVDDPTAGGVYIPAGEQTLNAEQFLTFMRASNFSDGLTTQAANQGTGIACIVQYLAQGSFLSLASDLDRASGCFKTDWAARDLYDACDRLHGFSATDVYTTLVPGYRDSVESDASYIVSSSQLSKLMEQVEAGERPLLDGQVDTSDVDPSKVKIEVRNGSGIDGGASMVAEILEDAGFKIKETGNADSYVYQETLVVYDDDDDQAAAEAVVSALGTGRAIQANGFYSFKTDVLVILGGDWKPQS